MRGLVQGAMAAVLVLGAARVGAAPAERCPAADVGSARAAAAAAVGWFDRVQGDDGRWLYLVDDDGRDLGGYSAVRHGGVQLSLEQAADAGIDGAAEVADRGLAWVLDELVPAGDGMGVPEASGTVRTGGSALLVRALLQRDDPALDDEVRSLGRFVAGQVLADGAVSAAWRPDGGRDDAARDQFFTGEVLWALVGLADAFPGEGFDDAAERVGRYLPTRDDAEDRFPPVSDHWAAYAYADLGDRMTTAQRAHAERLAGIVGVQVRGESTRWDGGLQGALRGGPAVGSGLGTLGEAGAGLLRALGPAAAPGLERRVRCVAGMLVARQEDDGPAAVRGAWFTDGRSRMDDQQHSLSALVLAAPSLAADVDDAVGGGERSHGWLWLLAACVAAANPPRWRSARRAGLVSTAVGLGVVALVSGPVLDVLDVSPASARLAAGAVVVVAALATMVRPRASATDGVAVGSLAVLALALGADDGARTLVGIALGAVLVAVLPDRWRRPAAAAAVACGAIVVGLDLVVDGVLGV